MRALAIAGVAIALVLLTAGGASSSSKDCGNGPSSFPGNGHPAGGHWVRCSDPPAPPPAPPPEPPVEEPPPSDPPAVSDAPACTCEDSPAPRARDRREPKRASRAPAPVEHPPPADGAGEPPAVQAPRAPVVSAGLIGVAMLFGAGAGLGILIAGHPGPPPTYGGGGR